MGENSHFPTRASPAIEQRAQEPPPFVEKSLHREAYDAATGGRLWFKLLELLVPIVAAYLFADLLDLGASPGWDLLEGLIGALAGVLVLYLGHIIVAPYTRAKRAVEAYNDVWARYQADVKLEDVVNALSGLRSEGIHLRAMPLKTLPRDVVAAWWNRVQEWQQRTLNVLEAHFIQSAADRFRDLGALPSVKGTQYDHEYDMTHRHRLIRLSRRIEVLDEIIKNSERLTPLAPRSEALSRREAE